MDKIQIITLIISAIALCISLINAIYFFVIRHRNLKIEIRRFAISHSRSNTDSANVYFSIENRSQLSISITQLKLIIDTKKYASSIFPETIATKTHRTNNEITDIEKLKSHIMPINLMPLASFGGHISFLIPRDSLSKSEKYLTFEISTNRGNPFQKTFELYENLHLF